VLVILVFVLVSLMTSYLDLDDILKFAIYL